MTRRNPTGKLLLTIYPDRSRMGVAAKIQGRLPDADLNGLGAVAARDEEDPSVVRTCIAKLSVRKIEHDIESGDATVKYQIDHIEPVGGEDEMFVESLLNVATENRTGLVPISGFEQSFGDKEVPPDGVDGDTGEVE